MPVVEKIYMTHDGTTGSFDFLYVDAPASGASGPTEALVADTNQPPSLDDPGDVAAALPNTHSRLYVFEDHPGVPRDVVDACRAYLHELRDLVGAAQDYLGE